MHRIVFVERNTFTIDFPRPRFPHEWVEFGEIHEHDIVKRAKNATILICNKLKLHHETLSRLPHLQLIAVAATGVDNVDLNFCRTHRITVCNTRGYATTSVPEHVLLLMLALRRNLGAYRNDVQHGRWHEARQFCLLDHPITDLSGTTLGIVGYGLLGQAMAKLGKAVGMSVLIAERKGAGQVREGRTPFASVLHRADVVTLHCPLTADSHQLIGAEEFRQMKSDVILINTARGALVEPNALLEFLRRNKDAGAGIDVLETEPPREGNVLLAVDLPNLIVTPHIAWASRQAMETLAGQLIENLEGFVNGKPRNVVS